MVQVYGDCMEKGTIYYKIYGEGLATPWRQTRPPSTVQLKLEYIAYIEYMVETSARTYPIFKKMYQ